MFIQHLRCGVSVGFFRYFLVILCLKRTSIGLTLRLLYKFATILWPACKEHNESFNLLDSQNTIPQKEELAISKVAHVIFPWQVERVLHLKFPGKVSRAEEAGFVSCIMCLWYMCVYERTLTVD